MPSARCIRSRALTLRSTAEPSRAAALTAPSTTVSRTTRQTMPLAAAFQPVFTPFRRPLTSRFFPEPP